MPYINEVVPSCTLRSSTFSVLLQDVSSVVLNIPQLSLQRWSPSVALMLNGFHKAHWILAWCRNSGWAGCPWKCARWSFLVISSFEVLYCELRWSCFLWSWVQSVVLYGCLMWPGSSSGSRFCSTVQGWFARYSLVWYNTWCAFLVGPVSLPTVPTVCFMSSVSSVHIAILPDGWVFSDALFPSRFASSDSGAVVSSQMFSQSLLIT